MVGGGKLSWFWSLIIQPSVNSNSNFYVLPKEHGMELDYNQVGKVGDWKSLFVGIHGL